MQIRILCTGRIKESFYRDAAAEYVKRLGRYAKISITEVQDEKTPDGASDAEREKILRTEGSRLLRLIRDDDYVIALAIQGKAWDSVGFASHMSELMQRGRGSLVFVIGGSLGLSDEVLRRASEQLSFSAFTFPHQLMRVILCEQIYRAMRIINGEPYHK
ncbi:MAG: 23S rRNA (pseudouridine(1915)-N(3))-methyltransferase RlmH [Lachnospiraceae bacterium]|nr:23S rRNA (pseudouridine(1915)-N(3))-methyltransferase RlmH [Lachnospiraceae bacterium]